MIQASDNYSKMFGFLQTKSFKEQIGKIRGNWLWLRCCRSLIITDRKLKYACKLQKAIGNKSPSLSSKIFPAFLESVYVLHLQILPDSACKQFDSFKGLQR